MKRIYLYLKQQNKGFTLYDVDQEAQHTRNKPSVLVDSTGRRETHIP